MENSGSTNGGDVGNGANGGIKFYLVGGTVRDELMGHRPSDVDYAVEAKTFQHMKQHLSDCNFQIFVGE